MIFLNPPEALLPKSLKNIYSLPEGYTKKNLDKAGATFGVLLTRFMIGHQSLSQLVLSISRFYILILYVGI